MRVLVVDDDPGISQSLERALRREGYEVALAPDGEAGIERVSSFTPDAIIMDVLMPRVDGLSACRRLRSQGDATPILVLTARHSLGDRVAGLDAGADDYVVKPFALEELLARLRALLRRTAPAAGSETLQLADLTRTEYQLLELLLLNTGQVLTRDQIFDRVWGYDFEGGSNSLDVYIGYLRRKTEAEGEPRLIHTVRGVGYIAKI